MKAEPLFLHKAEVKKAAYNRRLGTDPNMWQEEIIEAVMSSHPYLQDFNIELDIKNKAPESGMMFGTVIVTPRGVTMEQKEKFIGVPVIAVSWELKPLDVMAYAEKFWPLTEERLGEAFERTGMGQLSAPPGNNDPNLSYLSSSPNNSSYGDESKYASVLEAIADTVDEKSLQEFVKAAGDPEVVFAIQDKPAVREVFDRIDDFEIAPPMEEMEDAARGMVDPTVVQVRSVGDGYQIKSASAAVYDPIVRELSPVEFDELPGDVKGQVIKFGSATIVYAPDIEPLNLSQFAQVDETPMCKCAVLQSGVGKRSGVAIPIAGGKSRLWVGTDSYACQTKIAGMDVESLEADDVFNAVRDVQPGGVGTFVFPFTKEGETTAMSTPVMDIHHSYIDEGEAHYKGVDHGGRMVTLVKCAGVKVYRCVDRESNTWALPEDSMFLSLHGMSEAHLEKDAATVKMAAETTRNFVKVSSNGTRWAIDGPAVEAIPEPDRREVDVHQALFVLGVAGVSSAQASGFLKEAKRHTQVVEVQFDVQGREAMEKYAAAMTATVTELFSRIRHPGHSLVKFAASSLEDTQTLDSILSLGFLSPQNVEVFFSYIPALEFTLNQICELLMATRTGLSLDEAGLKTCMETMDGLISDLNYVANETRSRFNEIPMDTAESTIPGPPQQAAMAPPAAAPPAAQPPRAQAGPAGMGGGGPKPPTAPTPSV